MNIWKKYWHNRPIHKRIRELRKQQERLAYVYFFCDTEEDKNSIKETFSYNMGEIKRLKETLL